jgi:phosphate transport system protein
MREHFDDQLRMLNEAMEHMGSQCEIAIQNCITALEEANVKLAQSVIGMETELRREEREIENICLKLLLQQQPVASDLRNISAALKAVYDLERISIIAADMADIVINEQVTTTTKWVNLEKMAKVTSEMVTKSINALTKHDEALAREAMAMDDEVDQAFLDAKKSLVDNFSRESNVEYVLDLLMIAKYFEKIGDHAVNIAGWALFSITGVHTLENNVA